MLAHEKTEAALLELMKERGRLTAKTAAAALNLHVRTVSQVLYDMSVHGTLKRHKSAVHGGYIYRLGDRQNFIAEMERRRTALRRYGGLPIVM